MRSLNRPYLIPLHPLLAELRLNDDHVPIGISTDHLTCISQPCSNTDCVLLQLLVSLRRNVSHPVFVVVQPHVKSNLVVPATDSPSVDSTAHILALNIPSRIDLHLGVRLCADD